MVSSDEWGPLVANSTGFCAGLSGTEVEKCGELYAWWLGMLVVAVAFNALSFVAAWLLISPSPTGYVSRPSSQSNIVAEPTLHKMLTKDRFSPHPARPPPHTFHLSSVELIPTR